MLLMLLWLWSQSFDIVRKNWIFWILYVHLDTDIIRKMKEHYKDMVQSINFIYVDSEEFTPFKGVQTLSHISNPESVLLRLFCDRIPCDDWILYLDCDVLVMQDIRNLMSNIESTKNSLCRN